MTLKILISHAHAERQLADAWKELLEAVSGGMIEPWYSSDTSGDGGMSIGAEWREVLRRKIHDSRFVIAILSPASRDRPWVLWECGVANGLAQERAAGGSDPTAAIIPIIYSMPPSGLENPLSSFQIYPGDRRDNVTEICVRLAREAGFRNPRPELWAPAIDAYMSAVATHRPRRARTLDDMALWRTRFEQAIQAGRFNGVLGLRQQMYTAFGPGFQPLSLQLHDLLSKVMLEERNFAEAIQEADYGLSIDAGDVTLLHRKALVLAEQHDLKGALDTVNQLLASEPALTTNTEIAGLLGRIYREHYQISGDQKDIKAAHDAYRRAAETNPSDYYCALNAAELALTLGDKAGAEGLLQQALSAARVIQEAPRSSFWADFTVGQILLGKGDTEAALKEYQRGLDRQPAPGPRERQSALKGALRMVELARLGSDIQQRLNGVLS